MYSLRWRFGKDSSEPTPVKTLACLESHSMTTPTSPKNARQPLSQLDPEEPQTAGAMLRQAREKLGLSVADIAAVTRIPRNMIEHLERDRFGEYAAPVFARGHLINFAREVRLDPERVLLAYERQTGLVRPSQEFEPPTTRPARARSKKPSQPHRVASSMRKKYPQLGRVSEFVEPVHMVSAILLLCALFAGAFFLNGSSATAQDTASFEAPSEAEWTLEKDADQARWFLEQPAAIGVEVEGEQR